MRASPNWLVGNSTEIEQWESGNSSIAFPFADDSLPVDFPKDTIVDACVVIASKGEISSEKAVFGSVHIGPSMVSAFILVGGEPALYCNVLKDNYEPFTPVVMTSVIDGISGMLTFGNVEFGRTRTYRLNIPVSESAIIRPVVGRLEKFIKPEHGSEAHGLVGLDFPDGISISVEEQGNTSKVFFSADDSVRNRVPSPCYEADSPRTMSPPVRNINGIVPDEYGRMAIVFLRNEEDLDKLVVEDVK